MTVAVTTLRSTLATELTNSGVWQVFAFVPVTPIPNSVIIQWDDPMLEPSNNSYSTVAPTANFKIICVVPMFDNQGNLTGVEDLLVGVFNKLASTTALQVSIGDVSAPQVLSDVDMLQVEMSVSIMTSWS
jgi:hypothetical protein